MNGLKLFTIAMLGFVFIAGSVVLVNEVPEAVASDPGAALDEFEQCKIDCNEIFGGLDIFPPSATGARSLGWANCVLRCERKYWKRFDKESESDE